MVASRSLGRPLPVTVGGGGAGVVGVGDEVGLGVGLAAGLGSSEHPVASSAQGHTGRGQ